MQYNDTVISSVVGYCAAQYGQGSNVQALLLNESLLCFQIDSLSTHSLPSERDNETPPFPLCNQTPLI